MYQNTFSYTESRIQELRSSSAQPAGSPVSFGEDVRQQAAEALISLGNWIKPRSASKRSQGAGFGIRRAGLAS
jgi:hypothetical protein